MEGDSDTVCFGWRLTALQSASNVWQLAAISQGPTECKAPGYGPFGSASTESHLAWCSLSNHLLFTLSRSGWMAQTRGKGVALEGQQPVK